MEKAEVSGLRRVDAIPDPEGLDEDHYGDDGEADGEHGPHDADGPGVPHIVGVVDFSGFLGWKKVHDGEKKKFAFFPRQTIKTFKVVKKLLQCMFIRFS